MPPPRATIALLAALSWGVAAGCSQPTELTWHREDGYRWAELSPGLLGGPGFARRPASRTGVSFENRLSEREIVANRISMNGSGVAAGDVDGDGRVDLYFAGLEEPNVLYRNLGGLRFEDVTAAAGVGHEGRYSTGVVLADVDGDGDLDLLVATLHDGLTLYRNDGTGVFAPVADGGLESTAGKGNTTLALADVDADGDLDLYVTNYRERNIGDVMEIGDLTWENTVEGEYVPGSDDYALRPPFDDYYTIVEREGMPPERREVGEPDQLFLNDGQGAFREVEDPEGRFLDSDGERRGTGRGWGLAAKFQDVNGDGLQDLYVCNDFWTPDRLWINQGDGVFREAGPLALRSLAFSSMAVDFSDVDRDGLVDLFVTEMLSASHERRLRQYIPEGPYPDLRFRARGQPQYNRNALYVNRGDGTWAETSHYSGLEASEWSWATRFLDVDLDGYEDLLVATGFPYDLQDLDTQLRLNREIALGTRRSLGQLVEYPPLPQVNVAFRNDRDLTFSEVTGAWGFEEADVSHGMALADLDDDGDLDLAINRLNVAAALYENTGTAPRIAVRLVGRPPNTRAVGAEVTLEGGGVRQTEQVTAGGDYLSGSDPLVVFAAGEGEGDRVLTVSWPGGGLSRVADVRADRLYEIREPDRPPSGGGGPRRPGTDGDPGDPASDPSGGAPTFEDVSGRIDHRHREDAFDDLRLQPLLPVLPSHQGPGVSWIDLDGDGDDDLVVAAGRGGRAGAFENLGDGTFRSVELGALTAEAPGDQTTILGWAEDGTTRLVVGSANLEQGDVGAPAALGYRVGAGGATETDRLPDNRSTTGPLAAADYDGDGDLDLVVGGRFIPARYPVSATSRLFENVEGRFVVDERNAGALVDVGLVTGAVFTDYDRDGDPDLLLAREWGSLALFRNRDGRFEDVSEEAGLARYRGLWRGVATGDFDGDGRPDIVAANWGLNSPYETLADRPLRVYYQDFDRDGRLDLIESRFEPALGGYAPLRQLLAHESILNVLTRSVRSHAEFARATVDRLLGGQAESIPRREVDVLESMVFLNDGGRFAGHALPPEAQWSIGFSASVGDYDNDGSEDLFLSQNLFRVRDDLPRLDAGRGLWLKGDGRGGFRTVPGRRSGIEVYGEQRGAALADFDRDGRVDLVVTQNGGGTRLYRNRSARAGLRIRLEGPPGNGDGIGSALRLVYGDGTRGPLREVQAGSGYWSQNAATQVLGTAPGRTARAIEITWFDGTTQTVPVEEGRRAYVVRHPERGGGRARLRVPTTRP